MMKNYTLFLLIGLLGFMVSCKDDDDPTPPKLSKLTKVACYKGNASPFLSTSQITYNTKGDIASIETIGKEKHTYAYNGDMIMITGVADVSKIEYRLNKGRITEKKIYKNNTATNNEEYTSDEYYYIYKGTGLDYVNWTTCRPTSDGTGYIKDTYEKDQIFSWLQGNIVSFAQDKKEMVYEYTTQLQPSNFPFRVIASFAPVEFEIVNPINLLYGYQNNYLPSRAYWYNKLEPGSICAEYIYKFEGIGDYITNMTIEEKDYITDQTNTYKFDFQYSSEDQ